MRALRTLADIAGAAFIFDSLVGVSQSGGLSSAWADVQSASGLTAGQSTPAKYPGYTASNADFNGYPTLDWPLARTADGIYLETGALSSTIANPMTYIAAIRCTDIGALGRVIVNNRFPTTSFNANFIVRPNSATGAVRLTGSAAPLLDSPVGTIAVNETCVLVATANKAGKIYKNAILRAAGAIGVNNLDGVRIGNTGFDAGTLPFVGNIAAVGCWPRELGFGEIRLATTLLLGRYKPSALSTRSAKTRTALPAPGAVGGRTVIL